MQLCPVRPLILNSIELVKFKSDRCLHRPRNSKWTPDLFMHPASTVDAFNFVQFRQCYLQRPVLNRSTLISVIFCDEPRISISSLSFYDHLLYSCQVQKWIGNQKTVLLWGVADKRPTLFCNNTVLNKTTCELKWCKTRHREHPPLNKPAKRTA